MGRYPMKHWIALALWLLIVPTSLVFVYTQFPSREIDPLFILLNFVMLFVAMSISFKLSFINISVERWIIFVIFFQYGLFAEMIFMQLAIVILQFVKKSPIPALYRYTTNSLMFTIVSIISVAAFYLAGGSSEGMAPWSFLLAAFVYALTYSVVNMLMLFIILTLEKEPLAPVKKAAPWDLVTTMVFLPPAVVYSLLADQIGSFSVVLVGAPFLLILFTIKRYAFSGEMNKKLSSAVEMGHELTESLSAMEVVEAFIRKLKGVMEYDQVYLLDLEKKQHLKLLMCSEAGEITRDAEFIQFSEELLENLSMTKTQLFTTSKEVRGIQHLHLSEAVQSVMIAPIIRRGKTEGFLMLTSFRKNFFEELDKKIIELLAGYFETSISKAYHYEQTIEQGERCGLTHLWNFRYLSKQLTVEMDRFRNQELSCLSAIILDIDHFKAINDTYGHQSGNDILVTFAEILQKYETVGITLARYGGEEFVLLLPNILKDKAADLAERIRKEVESYTFRIVSDLSETQQEIDIQLTISLGVSSLPEDTDSELSLLRNADRALYIGGKQAGRNRVGIYEGELKEAIEI